jgi:hypothetical protein
MPIGIYTRPPRLAIRVLGPSIAYLPMSQDGMFACIDEDDAGRAQQYKWSARWDDHAQCFYAQRNAPTGVYRGWTGESLHQFILGKKEGYQIDHKLPGNGLDCRKANLRHATFEEQQRNKRTSKNNLLGLKGISGYYKGGIRTRKLRYRVRLMVDGKSICLGCRGDLAKAIALRDAGILKYHGEFGRTE